MEEQSQGVSICLVLAWFRHVAAFFTSEGLLSEALHNDASIRKLTRSKGSLFFPVK